VRKSFKENIQVLGFMPQGLFYGPFKAVPRTTKEKEEK
jgi:hypothetical protein